MGEDKPLVTDTAERGRATQTLTFAAHVLMFRLGPEGGASLKRVEAGEEDGYESEGEGTGSTELSDIRLLGRCGEGGGRLRDLFQPLFLWCFNRGGCTRGKKGPS